MPFISFVLLGLIGILSACLVAFIINKHEDKPALSYLWFLWAAFVAVTGYAFSELPLRREKIECGVFSFRIHKKYTKPQLGIPNHTEGDRYSGFADFYSPNGFTFFEYTKVPDDNKWRLERLAKHHMDYATEKDKNGDQEWFVSDNPRNYDVCIITDYHKRKHKSRREYRRDIVFFEKDSLVHYLCCLRLCRPSKFTLNRSHGVFFPLKRVPSSD